MTAAAMEPAGDEEASPAIADKVPPEALRLRAPAAPITRFQRGRIILLAAAAAFAVALVAGMALRSPHASTAVPQVDAEIPAKGSSEALAGLPKSYGDVPRLGPPLPGDLGEPILDRARQIDDGAPTAPVVPNAAATARQARQQALEAARRSALLVTPMRGEPGAGRAMSSSPRLSQDQSTTSPGIGGSQPIPARKKMDETTDPARLTAPVSPYTLSAGSIIAASLITGVSSDLPGMVVAQVTQRVFDSATGRVVLIPQGSRLIGRYDHDVVFGQQRALIVWDRLILPDGRSLQLDDEPATDRSGFAGLSDRVDSHGGALVKGAVLSTLLGVGSDLSFNGGSNLVDALRQAAGQNVTNAGNRLVSKSLDIKPTLTIRPGARVLVVLHRDLVLAPWRQ